MNAKYEYEFKTIGEKVAKIIENIEINKKNTENILSIYEGIEFIKGELIILASRTSVGKTAFALELVRQLSVNKKISAEYLTCGDTTDEYIGRFILSACSGVSVDSIRQGKVSVDDCKKLKKTVEQLSDCPIVLTDLPNASLEQLEFTIIKSHEQFNSEIIFIDDFDQISSRISKDYEMKYGKDDGNFKLSTKLKVLKSLARKLNIVIVLIHCLPKNYENRRPTLYDFHDEKMLIPRISDKVLLLHRERTADMEECQHSNLFIAKNDSGSLLDIRLKFNVKYMSFQRETGL